jgi:hypothetical protein
MPSPAPELQEWRPDPADVAALSPRAQLWLAATLELFVVDRVEGLEILAAMRSLSRVELIETEVARRGLADLAADGHPLVKSLERESRLFASLWLAAKPRVK